MCKLSINLVIDLVRTTSYQLGIIKFRNFMVISKPRKQAALAGKARIITGDSPLKSPLGPSVCIWVGMSRGCYFQDESNSLGGPACITVIYHNSNDALSQHHHWILMHHLCL